MSTAGVPARCCARVVGSADSQKLDNGSIFIAGNAMELVPSGKSDGEKHTFSRIFDVHASDKDVYESEVLPLLGSFVAGENVSLVTMGHHRGGHGQLFGVIAPLCVDAIFDQMQQRQASIGGDGTSLTFTLSVKYASVILGSDHMSDLLGTAAPVETRSRLGPGRLSSRPAPALLRPILFAWAWVRSNAAGPRFIPPHHAGSGSSELRIVRDAEALGGVQLPGLTSSELTQASGFHELFRTGRTRLATQHKPPAPSSVLTLAPPPRCKGTPVHPGSGRLRPPACCGWLPRFRPQLRTHRRLGWRPERG
jgi:hypothetical protein